MHKSAAYSAGFAAGLKAAGQEEAYWKSPEYIAAQTKLLADTATRRPVGRQLGFSNKERLQRRGERAALLAEKLKAAVTAEEAEALLAAARNGRPRYRRAVARGMRLAE